MTHLDAILARNTAFRTFAELMATDSTYNPTIDLRADPALYAVATALVAAGRDAYLITRSGKRVFAAALAYKAPEVLTAEYGIVIAPVEPTPTVKAAPKKLKGVVFAMGTNRYKAHHAAPIWFGYAFMGNGIMAARWNKARKCWNKSLNKLLIDEAFVLANEVPTKR